MSKWLAAIFVLIVSASLAAGVQTPGQWIKYTSVEGRYTVSLPSEPKLSRQEATASTGEKFPQYLAAAVQPGDVAYIVGYFDNLPGTVFSADAARDGMVQGVKGALLDEKQIKLGSYSGRELKVSAKPSGSDYIILARFYETEKRVYVLQLIFPKSLESDVLTANARKYFDSFQVTQKPVDKM